MDVAALILLGIKISIVVTVLGLGLDTSRGDATSLLRDPQRLSWSLVAMLLIMPLFAILVARTFDLDAPVKIALVALSVSPVPPIWPKRTIQSGGERKYAMGLLVASAVVSIVFIPIAIEIMQSIFSIPLHMSGAAVGNLVFLTVIAPLSIGIEIRRLWPSFAHRAARVVVNGGLGLLMVCALPLLFRAWPAMASLFGNGALLTLLAFVIVGLAAGHLLGGPSQSERAVLAFACASRHPAIALAIASANFPNEKLAPAVVLMYLLVSAIASTPYLKWSKRQADRAHRPIMALR